MKLKLASLIFILFQNLLVWSQQRHNYTINDQWKFYKGALESPTTVDFDDSRWETISIPHDWAISEPFIIDGDGSTGKLPWKAEGWYRRSLDISPNYEGKRLYLIFDGIMAFPEIYINGKLVGSWDYGYNSFYLDITNALNYSGKNVLTIHANTKDHDSRWYPGGGIFRKISMVVVNPIHEEVWGTYVTTPVIKPNYALVRINSSIENKSDASDSLQVEHIVYNPNGIEVGRKQLTHFSLKGRTTDFENSIQITNPILWDIDNPALYTVKTNIFHKNVLEDETTTTFGIRTIQFTADDGFYLNHRRVQLKGVNLHSDFGPLGVAFNKRAMERQLQIMKSLGVNAIRNSHNVAAPELLELCDQMGLLLFNEAFDKYDAKADILSTTDFEEFAHRNIKNFVKRDRNHPSIFIWSVGNEIGDVQWNINNGFKRLHTMVNYVKKYDPTRPVTLVCDNLASASLRHFDYYDVHSWNYGRRYSLAHQLEPNKSVIISESASTLSTRGFYEFPLPKEKTDFTNALQVSSYDLNAPSWAEIADDDFMWQQDEPYVAGEFVWTGFDYLGEPTPYENSKVIARGMTNKEASRSSYFGIVDLVGIPKDRYYLYKSYWKPEETTIHILPHWNWQGKEGDTIPVFVYTNGDCAELFINGKSQGTQCKEPSSKTSTERFRLMWNTTIYEPGELKAIAYKDGQKIGGQTLKTAGEPYQLKLTPDRKTIKANGEDLSYILVEAFDKKGNPCPLATNKIQLKVNGEASIAGVGNGNPQSFEPFKSDYVNLFYGKAMIILKSEFKKDAITLTATSQGLKEAKTTITIE